MLSATCAINHAAQEAHELICLLRSYCTYPNPRCGGGKHLHPW